MTLPNLGAGRVLVAFGTTSFWAWSPTWTRLDTLAGVSVAGYQIDRGRQVELERTDYGRATVELFDTDGVLDPNNASSPFVGQIEPLRQIAIQRRNPMTGVWHTRFRGFVEDWTFAVDKSQALNRVTISAVDIFEALAAIELTVEAFTDPIPAGKEQKLAGTVYLEPESFDLRVKKLLDRGGVPTNWYVVFSGNVGLYGTSYSPATESVLTAIQEAVDAELPSVSNAYTDRIGRFVVHGREAKHDPAGVLAGISDPNDWDWSNWAAGDGVAVAAAPGAVAQIRDFAFGRSLSTIVNRGYAAPRISDLTAAEIEGQQVDDTVSQGRYGIRSWSAPDLLTGLGLADSATALVETKRFAQWKVANYAYPQNRVTAVGFRTIQPGRVGSGYTWELLSEIDVSDGLRLTVAGPNGTDGFQDEACFVEGVHETVRPATPDMDDVTLTVDVSPRSLYDSWPFP